MRFQPPYRCDPCDFQADVPVTCSRCGGDLIDTAGQAPLPPRRPGPPYFTHGLGRAIATACVAAVLVVLIPLVVMVLNRGGRALGDPVPLSALLPAIGGLLVLLVIGARVVVVAHRRQLAAWAVAQAARLRQLQQSVSVTTPIAALPEAQPVRFTGRVRVLDGAPFAAKCTALDEREGRRFLIEDASGSVLFDDDCFELWDLDGQPEAVTLYDADEVDVVGQGAWQNRVVQGHAQGYRSDGRMFVLDGRPDAPLQIQRLPPTELE